MAAVTDKLREKIYRDNAVKFVDPLHKKAVESIGGAYMGSERTEYGIIIRFTLDGTQRKHTFMTGSADDWMYLIPKMCPEAEAIARITAELKAGLPK